MKKHLHGKRYIRARASVTIGRERRAIRKAERLEFYFNLIDWNQITANLVNAFQEMAKSASRVAETFAAAISEMMEKYHKVEQQPDGTYTHTWDFTQ